MRLFRWIADWYNREMDAAFSRGLAGMDKYLDMSWRGTSFDTLREAREGPPISSYLGLVGHMNGLLPSGSAINGYAVMSPGTALDDVLLVAPSGTNGAEFAKQWAEQFLASPKPHMIYDHPEPPPAAKERLYHLHRLNMLSAEETTRKARMANYPGELAPGGKYHFIEGDNTNEPI